MKVTFAGSSTLFGCIVTLGSPIFVGIKVGVGFISVLEVLGTTVGEGCFTIDEVLCVEIVADLISGRTLAILLLHEYTNNYFLYCGLQLTWNTSGKNEKAKVVI